MSVAVLLMLAQAALAAPAPAVKPPPPPPTIPAPCATVMTWRAIDAETHFRAEGEYRCLWMGRWWEGRWAQKDGLLSVEEWPADSPAAVARWSVRLSSRDAGDMGGTAWKIRPLAGRVD